MDATELARRQLERLSGMKKGPRTRKKDQIQTRATNTEHQPKKKRLGKNSILNDDPAENNNFVVVDEIQTRSRALYDVDKITIEWTETEDDQEPEIILSQNSSHGKLITLSTVEFPSQSVIEKKIVWDPDQKGVIATETSVDTVLHNASPPNKKKRSEVDNLLGDEGVQMIMRDQQICIDDNGTLLNVTKASKTRNQRKRQEEPEKTINDWNDCAMIARRRSSSFSTDSFQQSGEPTVAVGATEEMLSPPKITNFFKSIKEKMNKTLSESFDSIAVSGGGSEPNNNEIEFEDSTEMDRTPSQKRSVKTAEVETKKPKKPSPRKQSFSKKTQFIPKLISVSTNGGLVQVKIPTGVSTPSGTLNQNVCSELISLLQEKKNDLNCKLLLLGPIKFLSSDSDPIGEEQEKAQRDFLDALASFPKPIFAAVQGLLEGCCVTMLPLFDLVFGKYGTEFCCAMDPLPGMSILMSSKKVDQNRISEILYLGESATSTQALNCGLITKEISSKNDKEFEEKIVQFAKDALKLNYTERIRVLKRIWAESHLERLLEDLRKEY